MLSFSPFPKVSSEKARWGSRTWRLSVPGHKLVWASQGVFTSVRVDPETALGSGGMLVACQCLFPSAPLPDCGTAPSGRPLAIGVTQGLCVCACPRVHPCSCVCWRRVGRAAEARGGLAPPHPARLRVKMKLPGPLIETPRCASFGEFLNSLSLYRAASLPASHPSVGARDYWVLHIDLVF